MSLFTELGLSIYLSFYLPILDLVSALFLSATQLDVFVVDLDGGSVACPENLPVPQLPEPYFNEVVESLFQVSLRQQTACCLYLGSSTLLTSPTLSFRKTISLKSNPLSCFKSFSNSSTLVIRATYIQFSWFLCSRFPPVIELHIFPNMIFFDCKLVSFVLCCSRCTP